MQTVVKSIMESQGVTGHSLAKVLGGNRSKVYEVIGGYARATAPLQDKIAEALSATKEDLFDEFGMARHAEQ